MRRYLITPEAARHLRDIGRHTTERWGAAQAKVYLQELRAGFVAIVDRPDRIPARTQLSGLTDLRLHRVNHHYIVFSIMADGDVAIIGLLHERVDVPARLRALQMRSASALAALRALVLRDLPDNEF